DQQTNTRSWVCGKAIGFTAFIQGCAYLATVEDRKVRYSAEATQKLNEQFHVAEDYRSSPVPAFTCAWRGGGEGWAPARPLSPLNGDRLCEMLALLWFNPGEER
ncbi:MAG: hypothetical protein ACLQPD_14725, partial [Desulfomonilaceae bacterium]